MPRHNFTPKVKREAMKRCKWCGETKPLEQFHPSKEMRDGHINKCRDCVREYWRIRRETTDADRQRDRARFHSNPKRRAAQYEHAREWRKRNPEKYRAQTAVNNAVRLGKLVKGVCEVCGNPSVHGHHDDYSKPLEVRWLCPVHHMRSHGAR